MSSFSSTLIDHVLCSQDIPVTSVIQATGVDFEIAFQHNSVPPRCVRSFEMMFVLIFLLLHGLY